MQAGEYFSGKTNRTEPFPDEINSLLPQGIFDHMVIKINTMGNENTFLGNIQNLGGDFLQFWGIPDHVVVYSGQGSDVAGNLTAGVYQGGKFCCYGPILYPENGYLSNPVSPHTIPRGFYIDNCIYLFHPLQLAFDPKITKKNSIPQRD